MNAMNAFLSTFVVISNHDIVLARMFATSSLGPMTVRRLTCCIQCTLSPMKLPLQRHSMGLSNARTGISVSRSYRSSGVYIVTPDEARGLEHALENRVLIVFFLYLSSFNVYSCVSVMHFEIASILSSSSISSGTPPYTQ